MNRLVSAALLLLIVAAMAPALTSHAQGVPRASVDSQYVVNRYGYAIINETVKLTNNGSSTLQVPDIQFGFGSVSAMIVSYNVTGSGYSASQSSGAQGPVYSVSSGGQSLSAGATSIFSFKALVNNIITKTQNGTLGLMLLTRPSLSLEVSSLKLVIRMPASTQFKGAPTNYKESYTGTNVTYSQLLTNAVPQAALTQIKLVEPYDLQDFHPLVVYSASRMITVSDKGIPVVEDTLSLKNDGTAQLSTLTVAPLTSSSTQITVVPASSPPLLSPASIGLISDGIDLTNSAVDLAAAPGANLTISYEYPLARQFYNVSGGVVSLSIPTRPPISAFVNSYLIGFSFPPGVRLVHGSQQTLSSVTPFQTGTAQASYGLSVGWGLDSGVPIASLLFVLLLAGLFAARTGMGAEEEEEEESATERVTDMIKAFEEKTSLINGLFEEISSAEPTESGKTYFDELRVRLDTFRGRALQRLNEVKQKSTTQKFFELLNQIHETEREVDRAARDELNLYEQFYTKRMRKEVFDRLLPNYKKRLEKALNQLSDELNIAQRESKLL